MRARTGLRRTARLLALALFVMALPATFILGAVRFAFSWQPVYTYAVVEYHAEETTGIPQAELLRATHVIRKYFTNGQRDLDIVVTDFQGQSGPLFNSREIAHMRDVKALVQRVYLVLDVAAAYALAYLVLSYRFGGRTLRALARETLFASLLTIALIAATAVAASLAFDSLFTEFHLLSFSNDFWQLDPTRDHLVQIFPQGFWFDVTLFVGIVAAAAAGLAALFSGSLLLLRPRHATSARAASSAGKQAPADATPRARL